jgi:hypothetical protein
MNPGRRHSGGWPDRTIRSNAKRCGYPQCPGSIGRLLRVTFDLIAEPDGLTVRWVGMVQIIESRMLKLGLILAMCIVTMEGQAARARDSSRGPSHPAHDPRPAASPPTAAPAATHELHGPSKAQSASTVPWTIEEVANSRAECIALLAPIIADVKPAPPIKEGDCGTPSPVVLKSLGRSNTVELRPPVTLNCATVVALYDWLEQTVQPTAQSRLATSITRLTGTSGYQCRNRVGAGETKISDHAAANAVDIAAFVTRDNKTIDVETKWLHDGAPGNNVSVAGKTTSASAQPRQSTKKGKRPDPASKQQSEQKSSAARAVLQPTTPEDDFLHQLHTGACMRFTTVLGPEANAEHHNHFHLDLTSRRSRSHYCR